MSCTVNFGTSLILTSYTVSVTSSNLLYGSVSSSSQTVLSGGTASITISPKDGYQYYGNTYGGTISNGKLVISNVTSDITCKVSFGVKAVTS